MGDKDDNNNNNNSNNSNSNSNNNPNNNDTTAPGDMEAPWRKADSSSASRASSNPSVSLVGVRVTPATEDTSAMVATNAGNLPLESGPEDKRHEKQLSIICPQTQQENISAFER